MSVRSQNYANTEKLYSALCKKYPNINPVEGEDLNIERNTKAIISNNIKRMWNDKKNYPTIIDIGNAFGISDRVIYRKAKEFNLETRRSF